MTNSMLTCAAIIAVAGLMIAGTLSVGIAFAQPILPLGPPNQPPGPPLSKQVLQTREAFSEGVNVPADSGAETTATCNSDEVVTGGAIRISTSGSDLPNEGNYGFTSGTSGVDNGYRISLFNPGPAIIQISATAICAKLVDAP